jgi:hypothetical protein
VELRVVLASLNSPPFEPAEEVDLRFLYYKCCFLLDLASDRRRSEIHAFSVSDSCLRFNRIHFGQNQVHIGSKELYKTHFREIVSI